MFSFFNYDIKRRITMRINEYSFNRISCSFQNCLISSPCRPRSAHEEGSVRLHFVGTGFYPYPQENIKPLLGSMCYVAYSGFIGLGIIENEEVVKRGEIGL